MGQRHEKRSHLPTISAPPPPPPTAFRLILFPPNGFHPIKGATPAPRRMRPVVAKAGAGASIRSKWEVVAALALGLVFLLAPSAARAQDCGNPDADGVITCADQAWAGGISESNGNNPFTLIVGGGTATTVTAPSPGTNPLAAILATGPSGATGNNILVRVGSAGAVRIVRAAHPSRSRGVQLVQQGSGTATIDVRDTVMIGSSSNPMSGRGINLEVQGAGAASITNAADIYVTDSRHGIVLYRTAATSGDTTITNHGDITTGTSGSPNSIMMLYGQNAASGTGSVSITNHGKLTVRSGSGAAIRWFNTSYAPAAGLTVTNHGDITSAGGGMSIGFARPNQASTGDLTINNHGDITADYAFDIGYYGQGDFALMNTGDIVSTDYHGIGISVLQYTSTIRRTGDLTITSSGDVSASGSSSGVGYAGIFARTEGDGAVRVTASAGEIRSAAGAGIRAISEGTGAVTVSSGADITAATHGIHAEKTGSGATAGAVSVTATGGAIMATTDGIRAAYATAADGNGAIAVTVGQGASVTGNVNGILVSGSGTTSTGAKNQSVTVNGTVMGGTGAGVSLTGGGTVTVGTTGRVGATSGDGIRADGAGDLVATVAGTVEGDVRATGSGALRFASQAGSQVTGTVHNPVGPLTVAGSIGRLLYTGGATVTVAPSGRLTGVEGEVIRSAGDLSVSVAGTVEGDLRNMGGALQFASLAGSQVTGTVHDPVGPLTVRGSIGRLLYTGGATVTVAQGGRLTGVEGEVIRSAGDLSVSVAGTVEGDLRATGGALTFASHAGSQVTGTVHDPVGPLTVRGSIGRLLYTGGATVTVAQGGQLTGVEGEVIRSAGDLSVTVAGTVEGDLRATGGALTFASLAGSQVTGTVHDPVGPLTVAGSIGRLLYTAGGTVTVAPSGRLTGVEGEVIRSAGDLSVTVAGTVEGDLRATGGALTFASQAGSQVTGTVHDPVGPLTVAGSIGRLLYTDGGTVTVAQGGRLTGVEGDAIRSETGDLSVSVAGTVMGDIRGRGTGEHTVRVMEGGTVTGTVHLAGSTVTGTVHLAGSTVTVGGTVGRVTLENTGMVTVDQTGRVTGIPGGHGVKVGADSTVTNHGTIAGKIGIQAGAGSMVVNSGTVRSTDGIDGIAFDFLAGSRPDTLTLKRGQVHVGKIRGLTADDTVDLLDLDANESPMFTFVDENGRPLTLGNCPEVRLSSETFTQAADCSLIPRFNNEDTTAFALTDDMLSDLTGSIHAAVVGTGRPASPREGTPARGHVWATPFGGVRNQDGTDTLASGTHSFGGGLLGAGWGGPALHVGGFLGGSTGRLDVAHRQDVDMRTIFGGVYAQQARGDVRLDARLLVGHMKHDSTRRVSRGTANAEYTSTFFSPEVGVATRLPVTATLHATPRLQVRYAGLFTEGFRERGTGVHWDLQFAERTVQILEVRGAVGVPIPLAGGGRLEPRVGLEGRWLLAGEPVEAADGAVRLAAGGDTSVGTGTAGFRMTLPVAEATTLVGNFDGALTTEHAWRATGYLGLTYSF